MSAVQITRCSGAGKTTIAAALARRGLAAIDSDDDPLLARSVDAAGNVVQEPEAPDFAWLSRHSWAWNPVRLDELIAAAAPARLHVCGGAANELELADRFTHVSCWRSTSPPCWPEWTRARTTTGPHIGDTREYLRRFLPGYQARLRTSGAIPIDARQPLDQVVDAILSHTLASAATSQATKPSRPARP
jgi:hypothetical protein